MMIASMVIPFQVLMIPLVSLYGGVLGVLNHRATLVFMHVGFSLSMATFMFHGAIRTNVPIALEEAARVDGASERQCFFKIILPNLKGSLYTIVILSFLNSFKIYREAYLVAGAYPQQDMYLLQHLFNNWFVNLDFDKMAAAAVCTGGILMAVNLLLQRLER